jgi:hypothetical protein
MSIQHNHTGSCRLDEILSQDHQEIEALLQHYDELTNTSPEPLNYYRHRQQCINELIRLCSSHWYICETVLIPKLTGIIAETQIKLTREKLHKLYEQLYQLDNMEIDDGGFRELLADIRNALDLERAKEIEWARMLAESIGTLGMKLLAEKAQAARAVAPTRPHPGLSMSEAGQLAWRVAASMDRVRDYGREFDSISHRQSSVFGTK